ncbi:MAG: uroporphyrinogen-III C-methyltransferase [Polyangiales bacterium]
MPSGKVYLIGAGPGDPELITTRGLRKLGEADVVLYDALVHPDVLLHARPDARREFVGKRAGRASERQEDINRRMIDEAARGHVVARLKGGDPYLFGRGSEEAEALAAAGVAFEVVPGVPSTMAATAYAGISLTHRDLASSVAYITATESAEKDASAHDWSKLATATQTLVIFMGLRKLDSLMALLTQNGRDPSTPAAVVQWASLPEQRVVVGTVADIAKRAHDAGLGMPALTIVGPVVSLREQLRWFDVKPLFGKRVLVTRPAHQARGLGTLLRDAGAEPVFAPVIRIVPPTDPRPFEGALARLSTFTWVIFTSRNGVDRTFDALAAAGRDARAFGSARVVAIGPATRDALAAHGIQADAMPEEFVGEAVAARVIELGGGSLAGARVLMPRAAVARDALPDALRAAGATVDVVAAYETVGPTPEEAEALRASVTAGIDAVTFTSASTVSETARALGADAAGVLASTIVASIGPITTARAEELGIRVDVTASEYTNRGLVAALAEHFRSR